MTNITVEIWSDLVCPWCHLGKRRFERALAGFERRDDVHVRWRAFELDPHAPRQSEETIPTRMRRDLGLDASQAADTLGRLTGMAAEAGLDYQLAEARPANSFDAHRLMAFADASGVGDAVRERLMRAYTSEGARLGEPESLVALAAEAGLPSADAREVLDSDAYVAAVRADEKRGAELGVGGVPSFVFAGRHIVSGAQPVEVFADLLRRTWEGVR